ncbi:MAG: rod shape-determining protein MreC [Candidatus Pacebacteria bacterium]|nr:rod shape-determining protein MreC [Candidatus Paceibacterota bacterium]
MKIKKTNNFRFLTLLVIALITSILLIELYTFSENFLKPKVVFALSAGKATGSYLTNLRNWFNDILHFNDLRKKLEEIELENINLISKLQNFKKLEEENYLLKEAFKIKDETNWPLEMAEIVLMDSSGLTGSFWINKGLKSDLKEGMNVITENKVLVGRLVECFDYYCRGESIFRPETKISVEDLRSSVLAVAEIDAKGNFRLKLVPYESDIKTGDILVTSAENPHFLKGLLIAKVKKVDSSKETSAMREFILEPLISSAPISSVLIIKGIIP